LGFFWVGFSGFVPPLKRSEIGKGWAKGKKEKKTSGKHSSKAVESKGA